MKLWCIKQINICTCINLIKLVENVYWVQFLLYKDNIFIKSFLFKCIIRACKDNTILESIRIISSPSGAGTKRGIHNCLKRDCNQFMVKSLKEFVLSQNIDYLIKKDDSFSCDCLIKYQLQKNFI